MTVILCGPSGHVIISSQTEGIGVKEDGIETKVLKRIKRCHLAVVYVTRVWLVKEYCRFPQKVKHL